MKTVFLDEAGYTGPDLINSDQPVFTLAAICIEEEDAVKLKKQYFPGLGEKELKHAQLYSDERCTESLLGLIEACLTQSYCIVYAIEKRFLCCEMVVCDLIAPFRPNVRYGSQLFRDFAWFLRCPPTALVDIEEVEKLLTSYVEVVSKLVRIKNRSNTQKIEQTYRSLYDTMRGLTNPILQKMFWGAVINDHAMAHDLLASPLSGCAQAGLSGLITRLENDVSDSYDIVFDQSPSIAEFETILNHLKTVSPDIMRVSREVTLKLPLTKYSSMRSVDSRKSIGAQLADIIAGSALRASLYGFGHVPKIQYAHYDNAVQRIWDSHGNQRIFKPSQNNYGLDISNDVRRLSQAVNSAI